MKDIEEDIRSWEDAPHAHLDYDSKIGHPTKSKFTDLM